jgi:hypothetical protein
VHEKTEVNSPDKVVGKGNEVERMKQTSPFRSKAPRFRRQNTDEDESPGPGSYEAINLADSPLNTSLTKKGTSMFKTSYRKIDSLEYPTISKLNPTLAPSVIPGPGAYFEKKRPFLKKSYNASLPKRKFY